jgi:DNA/RNA endonuclease YhcR with UshA esterase domain
LPAGDVVAWENARDYIGRRITVEGTVVRAKRSGKAVFLNFHDNWKRYLTVVLFTGRPAGVAGDPASHYTGRRIRVRGTVKRYKGRLEIAVESAADIRVVP